MGFNKISELDPAALVNDSDLFAGVQEENNTLDNKKYTAEQLKLYFQDGTQPELTFDDVPVENSNNPVKSGGLYSEFTTKQDVLTFDAMPTDGSSNPVTSDGIEEAIASSEARSIPLSQKGEAGGVAELDSSGKVLSSQLPSYVDDVEEYLTRSAFPVFGEGGKIYIALDTNKMYRWSGTQYTEVSESLALGETSSTAYRGDRGKTAYDFSQSPYTSSPAMDGAASAGSSTSWARGDHVHPKDTSKQDVLTFDDTPTASSGNPVTSDGLYSEFAAKQDVLTLDSFFSVLDNICQPETHRQIFRGKNLGTSLTAEQKAEINAGTFKGLWLGDYWVINNVTWRIVDFDYWYRCGDTEFTRHHVVIMPDAPLYSARMNATNATVGGYYGSAMRGAVVSETFTPYAEGCGLYNALTAFQSAFGDALLTHKDYLVNAVTDGVSSGGAWFDSIIELPNEIMIYGTGVRTPSPIWYTNGKTQLALMQATPRFINIRVNYWLRDVVSASDFARVHDHGGASATGASGSYGVRPVGAIG